MMPGSFFYTQMRQDVALSGVRGFLAALGPAVAIDVIAFRVFAAVAKRIFAHGRTGGFSRSRFSPWRRPRPRR